MMGAYLARFAYPPPSGNLKDKLMAEIERRKEQNRLPVRGGFLTLNFIDELFTVESIAQQLQQHEEGRRLSRKEIIQLAQSIKQNQQKLYAILLLMDKSHHLISNNAKLFTDQRLFEIPEPGLASLPCRLEILETQSLFNGFASAFYEKQFVFPPSLPTSRTVFYHPHFIFPFANERERVGNGSFGEVYKVEIPNGFLSPLADEEASKNVVVAYKRIRRQETKAWERVDLEFKVLHQRLHRNITPLRGSFFAGMEDTRDIGSTTQCLYLLSPAASMSMQGWLEKERAKDDHILSGFIYFDTMLALASGLTYIHREIDTKVAYHRDIKPSNILLFHSNGENIWKFCDFGTSNLKPADDTGTTSMVTDKYWAPPEFFESHTKETHGRAHDIFSLGCVFLELATLLHMGIDGRSKFRSLRVDADQDPEASWYRGAFHRSMPVVRGWIEDLRNKHEEGQSHDVLALIFDMLRPIDERIYSWEVEMDLFILGPSGTDSAKVVDHLRKISHSSIGYSAKTKHNPYTRAKRRAEENHFYSAKCPNQFFQVMESFGWHEYSHQSTGSFQQTPGQRAYSNLSLSPDGDTLCGGQALYREISNSFRKSDIVALYGVAGIGKSRNASEYARQFVHPEDKTLIRHTFIVDATTTDSLMNSYGAIADKINQSEAEITDQPRAPPKITRNSFGSWLKQEKNGKWFMVVDGLDPTSDMTELKQILPRPRHGMDQMLITTRNRAKIKEFSSCNPQVPCIQVTALSPADSMRLFKQNIEEWERLKGGETDTPKIENLLEKLWSPIMIKYAANQIEDTRATVVQLKEQVDGSGLSEIATPFESYLAHVLQPLTGTLSHTSSWPREVGTLFLLAFFGPHGVKWSTLKHNHGTVRKRTGLIKSLGKLEKCALVDKGPGGTEPVYSINGNIREAILEWIEQRTGPEGGAGGLLERHSKALSVIYKSYQSLLETATKTNSDASPQLHQVEQPFMPHFEYFLEFTKKHNGQQKPLLQYPAVRAIICLSKVLLDQDRYEEAMRVTEYTRGHFKHKLGEADSEKQLHVFFTLGRHLVTIYLARPKDDMSSSYQSRARDLIAKLQSVIQQIERPHLGWDWLTTISLELKLDQIRLYRESSRFDHAHQQLSEIGVAIDKMMNNGGGIVEQVHRRNTSGYRNTRRPENHPSLRKLRIMAKIQDGLLHMAEGNSKYPMKHKDALEYWRKARGLLLSAEYAAETYCPTDELWHDEIRVAIAVVNTKIGHKRLVCDAIDALKLVRGRMEERYGLVRRTMDVEFELNEARLKYNKQHVVKVAADSSRELFDWYKHHFGEYAADTIDCASQLVRGRARMGETDIEGTRALIKQYGLEREAKDITCLWRWKLLLLASFLCVLLMMLCLVYRYQYI